MFEIIRLVNEKPQQCKKTQQCKHEGYAISR
jgi:hypothetical protein